MKVGLLTTSISRQSGGLLWAIRSLAQNLSDAGCHLTVFAGRDCDTEADLHHWEELDIVIAARQGPSSYGYMPAMSSALFNAELDLLHTHGLWMYPSVAAMRWHRKVKRPLVISPHGMLDPWALRNSAWKKRLAGWLYTNAHLRGANCIHALCTSEYEAIRAYGLSNPVAVIPNGVDLPTTSNEVHSPEWAAHIPVDSKVLLYLGRIHPKKGLVNLLRVWAQARVAKPATVEPWRLVIAGWDQDGHQSELERLAQDYGMVSSVHFVGPQFNEQKAASFARADAFVLPSLSEGLPMAVLEAWSYRLPVLMTDPCNLPEGFQSGAAVRLPLDSADMALALASFLALDAESLRIMGAKGHDLVARRFAWERIGREMFDVYHWLVDGGSMPDTVIMS